MACSAADLGGELTQVAEGADARLAGADAQVLSRQLAQFRGADARSLVELLVRLHPYRVARPQQQHGALARNRDRARAAAGTDRQVHGRGLARNLRGSGDVHRGGRLEVGDGPGEDLAGHEPGERARNGVPSGPPGWTRPSRPHRRPTGRPGRRWPSRPHPGARTAPSAWAAPQVTRYTSRPGAPPRASRSPSTEAQPMSRRRRAATGLPTVASASAHGHTSETAETVPPGSLGACVNGEMSSTQWDS